MMSDVMKYIFPRNGDGTRLTGVLPIETQNGDLDSYFTVSIYCPTYPFVKDTTDISFDSFVGGSQDYEVGLRMTKCMSELYDAISKSKTLGTSMTLSQVFTDLVAEWKSKFVSNFQSITRRTSYYEVVLKELSAIGWNSVKRVNVEINEIEFLVREEENIHKSHKMVVTLPSDYPDADIHQWRVDLPPMVLRRRPTLKNVFDEFQTQIKLYGPLWRSLDELDAKCWVLDPINPLRSDLYRRIVVVSGVSLHIALNLSDPPKFGFLGPESKVAPLRKRLKDYPEKYESDLSVLDNLKMLLKVDLPNPTDVCDDFNMECGICYSYKLGTDLPTKTCEDIRCAKPFHKDCIFEYMRTAPGCKKSLNTIFGKCPYCNAVMTCKISI